MDAEHYTLKDGRTLAYNQSGDPGGVPVFYAHGGPGSRLEGNMFHQVAKKRGYRMIATDRPGMGESTYLEGRRLLDYPKDISELADALGIDSFGVMGWSAGGAHTTVCGYAIPERLLFNITLAGYTNFTEMPGAETYLKYRMDQKSVALSKTHPHTFRFFFEMMDLADKFIPGPYYKELMKELDGNDREIAMDPGFEEMFLADEKEAFRQGSRGIATDAAIHYVDWGFRIREIPCTLHILHGNEDSLVPIEYGRHICENAPSCEMQVLEGRGHFFPYREQDLIFDTADKAIGRK
jgi:Predicted hydrolases or acyltransferases (alpha/beta hydrolase superfamily)